MACAFIVFKTANSSPRRCKGGSASVRFQNNSHNLYRIPPKGKQVSSRFDSLCRAKRPRTEHDRFSLRAFFRLPSTRSTWRSTRWAFFCLPSTRSTWKSTLGKLFYLSLTSWDSGSRGGCDLMSCGIYPHHYYMRFIIKSQILWRKFTEKFPWKTPQPAALVKSGHGFLCEFGELRLLAAYLDKKIFSTAPSSLP